MATVTPTSKSALGAGIATAAASAGGDVVTNTDGGCVILFYNGDGTSKTVTVKSYTAAIPPAGMAKTDMAVVVAANAVGVIGPLDAAAWNNSSGQVELTYSAVTSCRVGAYKGA